MSPRTALFGLFAVLGLSGQAASAPPVDPLVECREPDPVAREHHQPDQPLAVYAPAHGSVPKPGAWIVLTIIVWDALLDHLTIPLGTAEPADPDSSCGA